MQGRFTGVNICYSVKIKGHQRGPIYCLKILKQDSAALWKDWPGSCVAEDSDKVYLRRRKSDGHSKDLYISDKADLSPANLALFKSSAT